MLRHVVLLKFKKDFSEELLEEIRQELTALPEKIPQIISFIHGGDAGILDGAYDYAVTADFTSADDCLAYLAHPAHKAVGGKIVGLIADATQMQFNY